MTRTRILLADLPEILKQVLLDVLTSEPGFEVVPPQNGSQAVAPAGDPPDLVVSMMDDGIPERFRELFRAYPSMRLLGLKAHGRDAFLVELQPHRLSLGELSTQGLADAIRQAVSRPDPFAAMAEM